MSDNINNIKNLEKQITNLQEEIERLKWVKNLKVGDEALIKDSGKWFTKECVYCGNVCIMPTLNKVEFYFDIEDGIEVGGKRKLYPPTKENLESFEKQKLIEQIKAINFEEVDNDKLRETIEILNSYYDKNKRFAWATTNKSGSLLIFKEV